MEARLIRIGNSRGIRIPKALIDAAGLDAPLRLRPTATGLLIERVVEPRAGWAAAAKQLHERSEGGLLDDPLPTAFDEESPIQSVANKAAPQPGD